MSLLPSSPSFVSLSTDEASNDNSYEISSTHKVRFDRECVLIPDPIPMSHMPRLVTKSYSLPLWKRKRDPSLISDDEEDQPDDHVVFKVSVPSITTKARSPTRGDEAHHPLVSCLVHTDHSSSVTLDSSSRTGRPRGASLPPPLHHDVITIPLRACCTQCYSSIDKCMKEGDRWKVHFSRGALGRRKSVSDAHNPVRTHHCLRDSMPGFDAIVSVDEVDVRRRSTDIDALTAFTIDLPSTTARTEDIPLRRAVSLPDTVHPNRSKSLPDLHIHTLPPAILEEDERRASSRRTSVSSPRILLTDLPSTHTVPVSDPVAPEVLRKPDLILQSPTSDKPYLEFDFTSSSPITIAPPVAASESVADKIKPSLTWPVVPHVVHERPNFSESPTSSPSSSPRIEHERAPSGPESPRKKPLIHLSGSFFRASTSVLKGISGIGGVPMSV